jgi:hypothetical protein
MKNDKGEFVPRSPLLEELRQPERPGRPMLAWWGIFPAVVLFAALFVFSWPQAVERRGDGAVSYFVGQCLGYLLVSLGLAYAAYRGSERSQTAGTLAFTGIVALVCLGQVAGSPQRLQKILAKSERFSAPPNSPAPSRVSFSGFEFELPPGWQRVRPHHKHTQAMLLLGGNDWTEADGMLKVDVGKPRVASARQLARDLAGTDGHVFGEPLLVDGIEGIRVRTTSEDLTRPRYAVVVYRDGQAYLIMAATKGADIDSALQRVLDTWKWDVGK